MTLRIHNHYSVLPIIAASTWFITLLVLLLTWICTGRPQYASQEGQYAFISDVGADFLKPLFVIGSVITAVSFALTLAAERLLQHQQRLLPAQRRSAKVLSYCAIGGASLGGLALILLSGFDTLRFTTLHRVFLFLFMLGVILSAIFTVIEYRLLSRTYKDYTILRRSYLAKGIIAGVLIILGIIFTVMLTRRNINGLEIAAVIEWVIGFGFNLYLLTFWYDLRLAAPRNEVHKELRVSKATTNDAERDGIHALVNLIKGPGLRPYCISSIPKWVRHKLCDGFRAVLLDAYPIIARSKLGVEVKNMQNDVNETRGICVLSLDGGGPGSISQLRILEEFMSRLAYELDTDKENLRPADYFDMMGGVGFGGLCALLLGRLRMTVDQTMEELSTLAMITFPRRSSEISSPEANMGRLRESIESILERFNHPADLKLRDNSGSRCKVVVFAATTTHMNHCQAFRTYRSPHSSIDSTFVEAACAILANPDIFPPVSIGRQWVKQRFAGIPYGFNNPTKEVLKEARHVFGDEIHVALVLSIGSGQQPLLSNADRHETLPARIVNDSDSVARDLSHQLSGAVGYLRLNVDRGLERIMISDWDDLGSIVSSTEVYLEMAPITSYIDQAAQWLRHQAASVTLGQLIGSRKSDLRVQSQQPNHHLAMEVKQMGSMVQQIMEKITLVDAIGNRIAIPLHLCPTYPMLAGIIRLYFEEQRPPGSSLVKRGHYQLVSGAQKSTIGSSSWALMLKPGLTVEMSMVRHDHQSGTSCPRCGFISTGWEKNEWATCLSCEASFRITEELSDDKNLVSPAIINLNDTHQKEPMNTNDTSDGTSSGIIQGAYTDEDIDEWMKFRLILVVKHLETPPTISTGGDESTPVLLEAEEADDLSQIEHISLLNKHRKDPNVDSLFEGTETPSSSYTQTPNPIQPKEGVYYDALNRDPDLEDAFARMETSVQNLVEEEEVKNLSREPDLEQSFAQIQKSVQYLVEEVDELSQATGLHSTPPSQQSFLPPISTPKAQFHGRKSVPTISTPGEPESPAVAFHQAREPAGEASKISVQDTLNYRPGAGPETPPKISTHRTVDPTLPPSRYYSEPSPASSASSPGSFSTVSQATASGFLALFNQMASQKRIDPVWTTASSGPPHKPIFEVKVKVGNIVGAGKAHNKQVARGIAAKDVLVKLKWYSE